MRKLLLCLMSVMTFALVGTTSAKDDRVNVGVEIWIEPGQSRDDIYGWFEQAAENGMRTARLFLMWNFIEISPGVFDFTLYDYAFDAAERFGD